MTYTSTIQIIIGLGVLPLAWPMSMKVRLWFLSMAGAAVIFIYAPAAALFLLATVIEALVVERAVRSLPKKSMVRQYMPYVLLLNIFYSDLARGFLAAWYLGTLGVGFAVIRIFMTTKQLLGESKTSRSQRVTSLVAGAYFLPAVVVGPVFSGTMLWKQAVRPVNMLAPAELQYRKLFGGWILSSLLAEALWVRAGDLDVGIPTPIPEVVMLFGYLFATFYGRSLIAEGSAALCGFEVPQNFNKPWLASDFKDFWARWHISMARFVTQYIFLPLNLRGMTPFAATVAAFLFMGMWHELRPGYLIWGLLHGVLIATAPTSDQIDSRFVRGIYRGVVLFVVVGLSYVANYAIS
ncbi:MAG: hypothetical protein RLY50_426 [Actinomycetota bacterium]